MSTSKPMASEQAARPAALRNHAEQGRPSRGATPPRRCNQVFRRRRDQVVGECSPVLGQLADCEPDFAMAPRALGKHGVDFGARAIPISCQATGMSFYFSYPFLSGRSQCATKRVGSCKARRVGRREEEGEGKGSRQAGVSRRRQSASANCEGQAVKWELGQEEAYHTGSIGSQQLECFQRFCSVVVGSDSPLCASC